MNACSRKEVSLSLSLCLSEVPWFSLITKKFNKEAVDGFSLAEMMVQQSAPTRAWGLYGRFKGHEDPEPCRTVLAVQHSFLRQGDKLS